MSGVERVLVANRGEIAARVIRSVHTLGLSSVAVYSEADADSPHVALADRAVCIGKASVQDSYLSVERLLEAAEKTGAQAVHPGYGFLSESAEFAAAVLAAGLVWVGPPPEAIAAMGDKASAKARMREAGVPVVPGFEAADPTDAELLQAAETVGFPLMVKASAGGGGRGMRVAHTQDDLPDAISAARAEAGAAFGSEVLLLERQVVGARHVEVQVLADAHGTVLHLGERDCSVQRRHQKVVEEAPSPAVGEALRAEMGAAACAAARAVGYEGAGTVEFLLAQDGAFYFLEMNTRLQVEHPVTECVTGLDLVALQLRVALGEPLSLTQADVALSGHAIEVRLYAEDPAAGYRPQPGPVLYWEPPRGVRVDHSLPVSGEISPHYDPMVAKIIASGPDRETARRRLRRALADTVFFGVTTNRVLLDRILAHPDFVQSRVHTGWLDDHPSLTEAPLLGPVHRAVAAMCWLAYVAPGRRFRSAHALPWALSLDIGGERVDVTICEDTVLQGNLSHTVRVLSSDGARCRVEVDGVSQWVQLIARDDVVHLRMGDATMAVARYNPAPVVESAESEGVLVMPMAGTVLSVSVVAGARVQAGEVVARVEAMKLETPLRAPFDATVSTLHLAAGASAQAGDPVITLVPWVDEP